MSTIINILSLWFMEVSNSAISEILKISRETISKLLKKALVYVEEKYISSIGMIGGPGIIVEIDESKFGRRKYHRGHKVEGVWVLGMVERTPSRKILLIPVPNRNAETLINIIKRHVHSDSIIFTDCWKGYVNIKNEFSSHKTINHSLAFVDFVNNIHTNTIEGNWAGIKQNLPIQCRTKKRILLYLLRYMIKRNSSEDSFKEFIKFLI
ncbi:hypothetical protein H311_01499 [Anncaliia algerae PRA109]|nr:hypothetical protein H311_01499 [Anncaliia algerae PRA109]